MLKYQFYKTLQKKEEKQKQEESDKNYLSPAKKRNQNIQKSRHCV